MKKLCLVLFCLCLLGSSALADNVKVLQKSDAELRQMGFLTAAEAEAQARRQLAEGAARGVYQVDFVDDAPDGMTAHCVLRAYDEDEYIWSVQLGRADDLPIYDIGIAAKGPDRGAVQYMNYHDRHSMQALVDRYRVSHGLAQAIRESEEFKQYDAFSGRWRISAPFGRSCLRCARASSAYTARSRFGRKPFCKQRPTCPARKSFRRRKPLSRPGCMPARMPRL